MQWTWKIDKKIKSTADEAQRVIAEILENLSKEEWPENETFAIHLALEEAVMNAIKHGNGRDESKDVHVVAKVSAESFYVQVTDQGDGFVIEDVPDPTDDENLEKPSGRGLVLMKNFMSAVEFNESGNSVVMEKHRTAAESE